MTQQSNLNLGLEDHWGSLFLVMVHESVFSIAFALLLYMLRYLDANNDVGMYI